jgi:pimeloyl-ACP methyl ester carboxylesterase
VHGTTVRRTHDKPGRGGNQRAVYADSAADIGIDDVVKHFASIIDGLAATPVLIGHSFGGMIAEKLLGQDLAAAAIAIDAAQITGVLPLPLSSLRATLPVFKNPANRHRAVMLTAEEFRYSFGNGVSAEESAELYGEWAVPAPGRPLFEAAAANFSLKQYRYSPAATELLEFGDRGHSLTIDAGWADVADACLSWLTIRASERRQKRHFLHAGAPARRYASMAEIPNRTFPARRVTGRIIAAGGHRMFRVVRGACPRRTQS